MYMEEFNNDIPKDGFYLSDKGKRYSVRSVFHIGTNLYRKRKDYRTQKYYTHYVGKLLGYIC